MQSNKASNKKTVNKTESAPAAPGPGKAVKAAGSVRKAKSSTTKKSEGVEMTSGKHLHKPATPLAGETSRVQEQPTDVKPADRAQVRDIPSRIITHHEIAELAYSYFVARGYSNGSAEEDWLRAERELGS